MIDAIGELLRLKGLEETKVARTAGDVKVVPDQAKAL